MRLLIFIACLSCTPTSAEDLAAFNPPCRTWKVRHRYKDNRVQHHAFDWCGPRAGILACGFGARDSEPHSFFLGQIYAKRQRCEP